MTAPELFKPIVELRLYFLVFCIDDGVRVNIQTFVVYAIANNLACTVRAYDVWIRALVLLGMRSDSSEFGIGITWYGTWPNFFGFLGDSG